MTSKRTFGDYVAVKPITFNDTQKQSTSRLIVTDRFSATMIPTEVVFGSKSFAPGDTVFVSTEQKDNPLFKKKYMLDGEEFILIMEQSVAVFSKKSD